MVFAHEPNEPICRMDHSPHEEGNIRLITAAPELLEGSEAAVAMLRGYGDESSLFVVSLMTRGIAKARGE